MPAFNIMDCNYVKIAIKLDWNDVFLLKLKSGGSRIPRANQVYLTFMFPSNTKVAGPSKNTWL